MKIKGSQGNRRRCHACGHKPNSKTKPCTCVEGPMSRREYNNLTPEMRAALPANRPRQY